jgi:hypothetical protein
MKEALEIDADKRQTNRRRDFIESIHYTTASSRCRSKAALNGVILSSASWIDRENLKKKKTLGAVLGKSAWKSVTNVGSAAREVK